MPNPPARDRAPRPARDRSLAMVRWLVVALLVVETVYALVTRGGDGWAVIALVLLSGVANIVVLWRLHLGLVLAAVPIAVFLVRGGELGSTTTGLVAVLMGAKAGPRLLAAGCVVALTVLHFADPQPQGPSERTVTLTIVLAQMMSAGVAFRFLNSRTSREQRRIHALVERVARVRAEERAVLADELVHLLGDTLAGSQHSLSATDPRDVHGAHRALEEVAAASRAALAGLRGLVSTLRDETPDATPIGALVEAVDDALAERGYTLEVELPQEDATVLLDPELARRALAAAQRHACEHAPPGSTCRLDVTSTSLTWTHPVDDATPPARPDLAALSGAAREAGASLTTAVRDARWVLEYRATLGARRSEVESRTAPARAIRDWTTRLPPDAWRYAVSLACLVAAVIATSGAVDLARAGRPWQESALWVPTWLGMALLPWMLLGALALLLAALAAAAFVVPPTLTIDSLPSVTSIALAALVASRRPWRGWLVVGAWVGYCAVWFDGPLSFQESLAVPIVPLLGALMGLTVHHHRAVRAGQLAELAHLEDEHASARADERRRLAGELHDVLAHQLSLITLRVTVAAPDPGTLEQTLEEIAGINAAARDDLAALAALMRHGRDDRRPPQAPDGATPLATADSVAATLRAAGHAVDLDLDPATDEVDPTAARTLTRILREAGTNILRYAPRGSPVGITTEVTGDRTVVAVTSPLGAATPVSADSTGWGLLGLAERVDLTGGTFVCGPQGGDWVVVASLPRDAVTGA